MSLQVLVSLPMYLSFSITFPLFIYPSSLFHLQLSPIFVYVCLYLFAVLCLFSKEQDDEVNWKMILHFSLLKKILRWESLNQLSWKNPKCLFFWIFSIFFEAKLWSLLGSFYSVALLLCNSVTLLLVILLLSYFGPLLNIRRCNSVTCNFVGDIFSGNHLLSSFQLNSLLTTAPICLLSH